MENDEILKRFEFLDAERRKDRQTITDLLDQVSTLHETINEQKREIKHLSADLKKSTINLVRVDEFDEALSKQKIDLSKPLTDLEKKVNVIEKKVESQRKDDQDVFNKRLLEMQNDIKSINELKKDVQSKIEDDFQLNQKIDDLARLFPELHLKDEELLRSLKLIEDNYRIDSKRVSDIQVELTSLRKRIDEERISTDSQKEFIRKLEVQINDLVNREQLRNQEQIAFIETQSRQAIDRDSFVKDWQEKVGQLETLSSTIQAQMVELQTMNRAVKKSQTEFDDINQRLDRRINEISEMNRLVEERFRQEWIAFKADDQKRWTNYSLSQEENTREGDRELTKIIERITSLEDTSQKLVDVVHISNEETEKRIKRILTVVNEMLGSYERSMGKKG
jgi:chromosome segregation ATPase